MLPLVFSPQSVRVGIAGCGAALSGRLRLLDEAAVTERAVFDGRGPERHELAELDVLFVAGFEIGRAHEIYAAAKADGVLVNVEDVPKLCDFHVPAQLRRGDLLITISTGGRSPGLSAAVRETLGELFGPEWEAYLDETAVRRARWRSSGLSSNEIATRTREYLAKKGCISRTDAK